MLFRSSAAYGHWVCVVGIRADADPANLKESDFYALDPARVSANGTLAVTRLLDGTIWTENSPLKPAGDKFRKSKKADAFASAFLFVRTLSVSLCSTALPKGELYKRGSFKILFPRGSACQKMSKSSPLGGAGKADRL